MRCPQCHVRLKGVTTQMIGDTGICPKCRVEFPICIEACSFRARVRLLVAKTLAHLAPLYGIRRVEKLIKKRDFGGLIYVLRRPPNPAASQQAIAGFVRLGSASIPWLLPLLVESDRNVRKRAITVLARIGDAQVAHTLIESLPDGDPEMRELLVESLITMDQRAISAVVEALKHSSTSVRKGAIEILHGLGWVPENGQARVTWLIGQGAEDELVASATHDTAPLLALLRDSAPYARIIAARVLGRVGGPQVVMSLSFALRDTDVQVRRQVASALGNIGTAAVVRPLVKCLRDEVISVVLSAIQGLGSTGLQKAVRPLRHLLLKDEYVEVRSAAAEALGRIGEPAVNALLMGMRDPAPVVRAAVVRQLGQTRNIRIMEHVLEALTDPDASVRHNAVDAVGNLGPPVVEYLRHSILYGEEARRKRAIDALCEIEWISSGQGGYGPPRSSQLRHVISTMKGDSQFLCRYGSLGYSLTLFRRLSARDQSRVLYFALTEGDDDVRAVASHLMQQSALGLGTTPDDLLCKLYPEEGVCLRCGARILGVAAGPHGGLCQSCHLKKSSAIGTVEDWHVS